MSVNDDDKMDKFGSFMEMINVIDCQLNFFDINLVSFGLFLKIVVVFVLVMVLVNLDIVRLRELNVKVDEE